MKGVTRISGAQRLPFSEYGNWAFRDYVAPVCEGAGCMLFPSGIGFERQKAGGASAAFSGRAACPSEIGFEWQNGSEAPRHNGRMNRLISYRKNGEQGRARFGVLPVRRQPNARYPDHGHIAASLV